MPKVLVISDIHLSPTHGFFWDNWTVARDFANASAADAVVVNGDLAINGPESDAEIGFAAQALKGLRGRVLPLPGNHDVGDEPPGQDPLQLVDDARLHRWDSAFGSDRWIADVGDWRLVGVNAQLLGSGLAREEEQNQWLDTALAPCGRRRVAVFMHKPIFVETETEHVPSVASVVPSVRTAFLRRLRGAGVQVVVSGHLHQYRDRIVDGLRHLWAPAVAFMPAQLHDADPRCGLMELEFSGDAVTASVIRPPGLVSRDLASIKGPYRFLRDMPASPPDLDRKAVR